MISGWSDWVASLQIITKNLQAVGINANDKLDPDYNTWASAAFSTKTPTLLWQNASQGSPYGFFFANLSQNAMIADRRGRHVDGQLGALLGCERDRSPEPVEDRAQPDRPAHARDQARGGVAAHDAGGAALHRPALVDLPTKYFHGFASPKNAYADPIFTTFPDNVVSFTRIAPGGKAGA